jgi:hypothetical protein
MTDFFPANNYPGIFSTQEWISAWQVAWADNAKIKVVEPHKDMAHGRHGFYQYSQKKFSLLNFTTLFPAGISTAVSPSLRSEYFFVGAQTAAEFISRACRHQWDQLFIPDVIVNSVEYSQLVPAAEAAGLTVLVRDTATSYAVRIRDNNFANYLKNIGSNTRLKLYNKRKKLYPLGLIEVRNLWPQLDAFIDILNGFHQQRWGKPCYQGLNLRQITMFLRNIAANGGVPDLSVIYCDGKAISAVLDLQYQQRIYNIQSGYLEKFQDGISLGTLHLGMQIEKAFAAEVDYYDFMAGQGKHSNYKQSLATHSENFASLMLVRNPFLKLLYRINDSVHRLKRGQE